MVEAAAGGVRRHREDGRGGREAVRARTAGAGTTSSSCPRASRSAGWRTPELTFATPTVLAGDRSLVSLDRPRAGPLVVGQPRHQRHLARLLAQRGVHHLHRAPDRRRPLRRRPRRRWSGSSGSARPPRGARRRSPPADQILHIDLTGRDPDEAMTRIPYEKGALFLTTLEQAFGREQFDAFLAATSTTSRSGASRPTSSSAYLKANLLEPRRGRRRSDRPPRLARRTRPAPSAPEPKSDRLDGVERPAHAIGRREDARSEPRHRRLVDPGVAPLPPVASRHASTPTAWPNSTRAFGLTTARQRRDRRSSGS